MNPKRASILLRNDAGEPPATIAAAEAVSLGYVYGVLRSERPDRKRKARVTTSDKGRQIRGLAADGHKPKRIAFLCDVSRQYVYRELAKATEAST